MMEGKNKFRKEIAVKAVGITLESKSVTPDEAPVC